MFLHADEFAGTLPELQLTAMRPAVGFPEMVGARANTLLADLVTIVERIV
jgi:hypothetical protein